MAFASEKIALHWPDHAEHNTERCLPSFDRTAGYLCGCGEHLGWPVQDEPEEADDFEPDAVNTTFQRPASDAGAAAWDKAAAAVQKARQGAYGTWGGTEPVSEPPEPQPEDAVVVIEDGDGEDVGYTPMPAERVDADGMSYGPPEDAEIVSDDDINAMFADRERADGPVADEAQTYSVGGAGDGEVEYDPTQDPEWLRVQAQSDADEPDVCDGPDTFLGGLPEEHDAVFGKPESTVDQESAGQPERQAVKEVDPEDASGSSTADVYDDGEVQQFVPLSAAPEPGTGTPILPVEGDLVDPVSSALPAPLDPTEVYTPHDVELAIVDILGRLERGEYFLRVQISRLHLADYALLMRKASSLAKSDRRAADQREAEANLACAKEIYEQSEAAMLVRALRDTMHTLRSRLSGYQSVGRSVGASVNAPSFRP
jgi:hypothetical protein